MPMSLRARFRSTPRADSSTPSTRITPRVGSSSRLMQRRSVLLPEPDGPMTMMTSRGRTRRLTPFRTSRSPNDLCRPSISSRKGASAIERGAAASTALRGVPCGVVALETRRAPAGEDRGEGRVLGRRLLEPLLVVLHEPAVALHALDRLFHLVPERDALEPQREAEVASRVLGEPHLDLLVLARRVVRGGDLVEGREGPPGDDGLDRVREVLVTLDVEPDLRCLLGSPGVGDRAAVHREDLALQVVDALHLVAPPDDERVPGPEVGLGEEHP